MPIPYTPRNPATIARYRTRYEVEIVTPSGTWIGGYTVRVTRAALLDILRRYADDILPYITDTDPVTYRAGASLMLGPVSARVTGRTERDAYWATMRGAA